MAGERTLKVILAGAPTPDGAHAIAVSEDKEKAVFTYVQGKDNRELSNEQERRLIRGTGELIVFKSLAAARKALSETDELDAINAHLHDKAVKAAAQMGNSSTGKPSAKAQLATAKSVMVQISEALKRGDQKEALRLAAL